jgi:DNA-binding IclR family transcriptional regulator
MDRRGDQISEHETRVCSTLRTKGTWLTSAEIAALAGVAGRTARHHARALVVLGVAEQTKMHGGFRYRWRQDATVRAPEYLARLGVASEAMSA